MDTTSLTGHSVRVPERARLRYHTFITDSARWDAFEFRPDDIVISTPVKSGTTWAQMICALLIFQTPDFGPSLGHVSPWLDMLTRTRAEVMSDLQAQQHRRFIKTHTPLDGLPFDERVTYVCVGRDPRDVALSWQNHRANQDRSAMLAARETVVDGDGLVPSQADEVVRGGTRQWFWEWIDDPTPPHEVASSLRLTLHHLSTFWSVRELPNVVMLHYDDLKADLGGQMRELSHRLGIHVREEQWQLLVEAATLRNMRANADRIAPNADLAIWHDNEKFFNRGDSGQWKDVLDPFDLQRYETRVASLAAANLAAWAHHEPNSR
jgi:aryl sulfotransferase